MGFVKFLGTAGARFVMIRQLRSSGGIWVNFKSTNIIIDPGPGAIVRCNNSRPRLDVSKLDAVILTHKHLDHSGDVNVMIEAMTQGGSNKRGLLFLPQDSLGREGVIFSYLEGFAERVIILKQGDYTVGDIKFKVAVKNLHQVDTYGVKLFLNKEVISFVSDTKYFDGLISAYKDSTVLVLNVVFKEKRDDYCHLSLPEALEIIRKIRPRQAILTHFGMSMLRAKPHIVEKEIRIEFPGVKFAYDGYMLKLPVS